MSPSTAFPRSVGLSTDWRVGFLGDLHGDLDHLLRVAQTMWAHGISTLVVLGDFGFIWPDGNWVNTIDKISRRLGKLGQVLYFVDGNHEDFTRLYRFPVDADGVRRIRPNIIHLPRGYRTTLVSGREVAVLGGANSIDRDHRVEGRSWWAEEAITEADLTVLGSETAPLLIGHDAPLNVPALERELAATDRYWSAEALAYAAAGRAVFHRGFLTVQPELYLGGHYHLHIDEQVTYHSEGGEFTCRVVILNMNGTATSQAILDVDTFTLKFLTRDADTVHELRGDEAGVWEVTTEHSIHILDLDRGVSERRAGPDSLPFPGDNSRPLRTIERCRVGELGFWTFISHNKLMEYYWHQSTEIKKIQRIKRDHPGDKEIEGPSKEST